MCLFKFLVTPADPQYPFTLSIVLANLSCFFVITVSYILIYLQSAKIKTSLETSVKAKKLRIKIILIIVTDFLAWVPFTIICLHHFYGYKDFSNIYPFLSVILLPINSMLNPILYNVYTFDVVYNLCMNIKQGLVKSKSSVRQFMRSFSKSTDVEEARLDSIQDVVIGPTPSQDEREIIELYDFDTMSRSFEKGDGVSTKL